MTTFAFDVGNPQFLDSVTVVEPVGGNLTTLLDFDPLLGLQTSVTGSDGLTTIFQYDVFGRLTLEDPPGGSTTVSYRKCATGGCFAPDAAFYVQAADSTGATGFRSSSIRGMHPPSVLALAVNSKLATAARQAVLAGSRRLTPEGRLEAFLVHSRLMTELYLAGRERREQAPDRRR